VTYLLSTRLGPVAERRFVESVAAGELDVEAIQVADLARCAELLTRYPTIGFVDASVPLRSGTFNSRSIVEIPRVRLLALAGSRDVLTRAGFFPTSHMKVRAGPNQLRSRAQDIRRDVAVGQARLLLPPGARLLLKLPS